MVRSMTAYARGERQGQWGRLSWELRSVNHRYLEISTRLPEAVRSLEPMVRERASAKLGRGKVELNLRLKLAPTELTELNLNHPLARQLLKLVAELDSMMGTAQSTTPMDLLRWPGVAEEPEPDLGTLQAEALAALDDSLEELIAHRTREGEQIQAMIEQRCEAVAELVAEARARRPEYVQRLREKLMQRLGELDLDTDPARLEQELVLVAQRLDVDEELDRLDAHLKECRQALARQEPIGRRLDFLMQELNREANTLASKSADSNSTRIAVELKVLIEQMREQIQNVE